MSAKFLILRRILRDIITNVHVSSGKITVILARFEQNLNCLKRFSKKSSNTKFLENLSSGSRVIACGLTDTTKLVVTFSNKTNTLTKKSRPD
jgi:hypothetical protein